jgi:pentatricopeptide repeat protein
MQTEGISPDATTVASLVKGCSLTGTIDRGKEMHILAVKIGCGDDPYLCKMLIDMYAKCVSLIDAHDLLWRLERRDLFLWSAVIAGHAQQGETGTVFRLIEQMRADGLDPDGVTSLSILSACNHGGLVDVGQRCFEVMIEAEYCNRISLDIEHHNCMIDLLGRAGQLGRALSWLGTMPFPPNYVTWSSILGACQKWQNSELGQRVFELAARSISEDDGGFYFMYNIYADHTEYSTNHV